MRHATVPHQMTFSNKFSTEQGAALLLRQHNNAQSGPEDRSPLWGAARSVEIETTKAASMPGPAPCIAVNEAAHTSRVPGPKLEAPQQEEGSKYELVACTWNDYSGLRTAPASGACPRREGPFAEATGLSLLKLMLCALGAAALVGKSKPRR